MTKYHVNNETGEYGKCSANIKCPFNESSVHVENLKEAQNASERIMAEKYVSTPLKKEALKSESMFDKELFRNVKKMPALFVIDRQRNEVTTEINESAVWIFEEESKATYKRDGTSITVDESGKVWANLLK